MVTATHTSTPHEVDRTVAAVFVLILMVAAIAAFLPTSDTDRVVPQTNYLEIESENSPTGLSFQTP